MNELQHVAIIMDGNGRWARRRGLPRTAGHRQGLEAARRVAQGAVEIGIPYLTLFAFSEDNWERPEAEVGSLLALAQGFLLDEARDLADQGISLRVIGDRERLSESLREAIREAERVTRFGRRMVLTIAFNYGGRWDLTAACRKLAAKVETGEFKACDITQGRLAESLATAGMPDPDVVIRTAGELRISNFLLWQMAYAELFFSPVVWPDFGPADLQEAVRGFAERRRTFGRVASLV